MEDSMRADEARLDELPGRIPEGVVLTPSVGAAAPDDGDVSLYGGSGEECEATE